MALDRRTFLGALAAGAALPRTAHPAEEGAFMLPEWHPHAACVMTWCDAEGVYGPQMVRGIREEQARIAKVIAKFEPVVMLANPLELARAKRLCGPKVQVVEMAVDDLWARDTMPILRPDPRPGAQRMLATGWNFNVWGEKYPGHYTADRTLARRYAEEEGLRFVEAPIVAEGGAMESDGVGTVITTETCLLNPNRNPALSKTEVTRALQEYCPCKEVIWLWGSEVDTVTDGHVDGLARIIRPGVVVVEVTDDKEDPEYHDLQENAVRLEAAKDARGKKLEVIRLNRPRWEEMPERGGEFAPSYVNGYFPNGGLIMPRFGDRARDIAARQLFEKLEPKREILQLDVDWIGEAGGGIHCATMQIPA